jgi:hypothetical protein
MINDYELQEKDLYILIMMSDFLSSYTNLPKFIDFELDDEKHKLRKNVYVTDNENRIIGKSGGSVSLPSFIFKNLKEFHDLLERLGLIEDGGWGYYHPDSLRPREEALRKRVLEDLDVEQDK